MATVQPYVFFDGKCEEAIKFYSSALGAQTQSLMRYKDCPDPKGREGCGPGNENKVMHANIKIRDTEVLMADGHCGGNPKFEGFGLALQAKDNGDAEKLFAALSDGGKPLMPMSETFFAHRFGMVTDKFGVMWMVLHAKQM
ncbi:MAG TPA: VOC family protein [Pirellulales bacterium]|jgi:PhnB protein